MKHSAEQLDQTTDSRLQRVAKRAGVLLIAAPTATLLLSGIASAKGNPSNPSPDKAPHAAASSSPNPTESPSPTATVSPSPDVTPTSLPSETTSPSPDDNPTPDFPPVEVQIPGPPPVGDPTPNFPPVEVQIPGPVAQSPELPHTGPDFTLGGVAGGALLAGAVGAALVVGAQPRKQ